MYAGTLSAQQEFVEFGSRQYVPYGPLQNTPDWDWFAPVSDADVTGPPYQEDGYFFGYERLNWWIAKPNRSAIGAESLEVQNAYYNQAVNYVYFAPAAHVIGGLAVAQLSLRFPIIGAGQTSNFLVGPGANVFGNDIANSIDVAVPTTNSGNGNRWEFGYVDGKWGWMASVIDRIEMHETYDYGFDDLRRDEQGAAQGIPGVDGLQVPTNNIVFRTNVGIIIAIAPTALPPLAPVPSIQGLQPIDGLLTVSVLFEDPNDLLVGFIDGNSDGLADDINGDLIIDQNDMLRLAPTFDDVRVRNNAKLSGVELMSIRRKRPTYHGLASEVYLGVRFLELDDWFGFSGRGGILADTEVTTRALNRIVGPQFGFRFAKPHGRWNFNIQGRAMFGANFMSIRQNGAIADHLTPGLPGVPFRLAPITFSHYTNDEKFSPVGELRAEASIRMFRGVSAKIGWNGIVMGGITRGSNATRWRLPDMGIINSTEEAFIQGVNAGFEVRR